MITSTKRELWKEATNRASNLKSLPRRLLNEYSSKAKAVSGLKVTQETSLKKCTQKQRDILISRPGNHLLDKKTPFSYSIIIADKYGCSFHFFTFYFFTKTVSSVEAGGKAKHKFAQACLDYAEVLATVNHQVLLAKLANFWQRLNSDKLNRILNQISNKRNKAIDSLILYFPVKPKTV